MGKILNRVNVQNLVFDKNSYFLARPTFFEHPTTGALTGYNLTSSKMIIPVSNISTIIATFEYDLKDNKVDGEDYLLKLTDFFDEYVNEDKDNNYYTYNEITEICNVDNSDILTNIRLWQYQGLTPIILVKGTEIRNMLLLLGYVGLPYNITISYNDPNYQNNSYVGTHLVLDEYFLDGDYYFQLDVPYGETINGGIIGVNISAFSMYLNLSNERTFVYQNNSSFENNSLAKSANKISNTNMHFLTNYPNKIVPYINQKHLVEQTGAFRFIPTLKTINEYIADTGNTGIFTTGSFTNTISSFNNTTLIDTVTSTFSYVSAKKSINSYPSSATFSFGLNSNINTVEKKINIYNIKQQNICDWKKWINIKYINPYGVWDSMTLIGTEREDLNVNKTIKNKLNYEQGINVENISIGLFGEIKNNEIKKVITFDSDYLNYEQYTQFGEVLESKYTKIYTSDDEDIIYDQLYTAPNILIDFGAYGANVPIDPLFGEFYFNEGFNITIAGSGWSYSHTLASNSLLGVYVLDALDSLVPILAPSFPEFDLTVEGGVGTETGYNGAIRFTAKNLDPFWNITTYTNSSPGTTPLDAKGIFTSPNNAVPDPNNLTFDGDPYVPILIEDSNFDVSYPENDNLFKINFKYSYPKILRN